MRHGIAHRAVLVAALATVVILPFGTAADAADVTGGCSGSATSYNADGDVIDNAEAPGAGGTQARPFMLDPKGSVAWYATSKGVITTGTWAVSVGGAQVLDGKIDNKDKKKSADGLATIDEQPALIRVPLQYMLLTDGTLEIQASVSGSGQSCTGTVWVTGIGSPTGSPMFWMGAGVLIIAVIILMLMLFGTTATAAPAAAPAAESIHGMGVK